MCKKFTEEEIAWMREIRAQGLAYQQIADRMPTKFPDRKKPPAKSAVYEHTRDVKVRLEGEGLPGVEVEFPEQPELPVPSPAPRLSDEDKKKIVQRFNEGVSPRKVAEEFPYKVVLEALKYYEKLEETTFF